MKRRYFYLGAGILSLILLSVAIFVGCSAERMTEHRVQTNLANPYSGHAVSAKTPTNAEPTARHAVESQPNEELWIIGRADKQQPAPSDQLLPGSGVLATQVENK